MTSDISDWTGLEISSPGPLAFGYMSYLAGTIAARPQRAWPVPLLTDAPRNTLPHLLNWLETFRIAMLHVADDLRWDLYGRRTGNISE